MKNHQNYTIQFTCSNCRHVQRKSIKCGDKVPGRTVCRLCNCKTSVVVHDPEVPDNGADAERWRYVEDNSYVQKNEDTGQWEVYFIEMVPTVRRAMDGSTPTRCRLSPLAV